MMALEAITAQIYIVAAIIISILAASIIGVALSIILQNIKRSDHHAKNHRAVHPKGEPKPTGTSDVAEVHHDP